MRTAPSAVGLQILALAAVSVIDAAVQHQIARAGLELIEMHLTQQRYGVVVVMAPAVGVELPEQQRGIMVPTPGKVARNGPQALLDRRDESG